MTEVSNKSSNALVHRHRTRTTARFVRLLAICLTIIPFGIAPFGLAQAEDLNSDQALEVRPSLMWLSSNTNVSVFGNESYDSFLGTGELWKNNWGVSANLLQNNNEDVFGLPADSEYFNLDVKRRFGSRDKSNVELGLGWQELNIESALEARGPRVSVAGELNLLSSVKVYGATSYFPELESSLPNRDANVSGFEVEAGVSYTPLPSLSLKAGYRHFDLDLEDPVIEDLGTSSGFLLGTDLSW